MRMKKMCMLTLFPRVFFLVTTVIIFAAGNLNFNSCPAPRECESDCKANHNAAHGFCGNVSDGDFNCYCSLPEPKKIRLSPEFKKDSVQCKDELDGRYDVLCRIDCQCAHAALDGKCNFKTEGCECIGGNPKPKRRGPCKFNSLEAAFAYIDSLGIPNVSNLSSTLTR